MIQTHIYRTTAVVSRAILRKLPHQETHLISPAQHPPPQTRFKCWGRTDASSIRRLFSNYAVDEETTTGNSSSGSKNRTRGNAYHLFSLPLSFTIDEELLRTRYHDYMKVLHPDKQQRNGNDTTEDHAAKITHAYDMLKRPNLRAVHLLKIMSGDKADDDLSSDDDSFLKKFTDPKQDFLLSVMDLQELIEELHTDEELKPYFDDNVKRIQETCQGLQEAFESSNITQFQILTIQLKYWTRIDETLRKKMTSLD
jgi:Fe-S protein assembly co-chaperone HscB